MIEHTLYWERPPIAALIEMRLRDRLANAGTQADFNGADPIYGKQAAAFARLDKQ